LQFYFGGCDLIDLYYLKERQLQVNYWTRPKPILEPELI
jgi:hypothetical protein